VPLTAEQNAALKLMAKAAVDAEQTTGLPAELSIAQCIVESAWLKRAPGNNCFGIKDTERHPGCQYCLTKEFLDGTWQTVKLPFEKYQNLSACFSDHGNLLTGGYGPNCYSGAWAQYKEDGNLDALILGVAKHYATDPDYAKIITILAHGPNIERAIVAARREQPGGLAA
jgi:peptidoglycan hydrolase FlgJ